MKRLLELVTDEKTGKLSHTKVWSNVAYAVATFDVAWQGIKGTLDADTLFVYLAIVGGATLTSKFLSLKYSGGKGIPDAAPVGDQGPSA